MSFEWPWNRDISQAPRGHWETRTITPKKGKPYQKRVFVAKKLIVATECGKVVRSYWIGDATETDRALRPHMKDDSKRSKPRWEMFTEGQEPVAWMDWPPHPDAT